MKIELKGSLWKVTITSGCYSSWDCDFIVVSGNTYEEAKNVVKIYYQEAEELFSEGIIFDDGEKWQHKGEPYEEGVSEFSNPFITDYGRGENVKIERLSVVYDGGEVAKETLLINK